MKILITGAGGFVGRRLVPRLAKTGNTVLGLVHRPLEDDLRACFEHPLIEARQLDLVKDSLEPLGVGFDAVIALAQSQHFRQFPERAQEIFAVNVAAHMKILEWARTTGVRKFIYASSGGIYGSRARIDVSESDLLAVDSPLGFYLGSKLCAEVMFQNYRDFFETAAILRPFFIYGPGQRPDMLVPRLITAVRQGHPIKLQGQDGLRINPIYVDDAASAFAGALDLEGCRIINVAGPETCSLRDIGERLGRMLGRPPVFETATGAPSDYVANIDAAKALLGAPKIALDEGLTYTIRTGRGA
jgi:nucleoside-diphosphate-sugar epimerase